MSDAIVRNQAFALRLLADLTRLAPERRRALGPDPRRDAEYVSALAGLATVVSRVAGAEGRPPVDRFFAAADLVIDGWDETAEVTAPVRAAVRALVLHSEPALRDTFAVLYHPMQPHVPFEALLLG